MPPQSHQTHRAYRNIHLNKMDLTHLQAFLKQLNDVDDKSSELILNAKILNTLLVNMKTKLHFTILALALSVSLAAIKKSAAR